MRRVAIINQKGGVGKTTTAVNVAAALARGGHRVLLIDLDPQSHATLHFGIDPTDCPCGVYELLMGNASVAKARTRVINNLWVVPASIDLAAAEVELVSVVGREVILRDLIDQHVGQNGSSSSTPSGQTEASPPRTHAVATYDYILMDCPPSLGVLTLNGLCAADEVMIPLQTHYLALQGLSKLLETVLLVSKRINPALRVSGVVACMYDAGTKLATEVVDDVRAFLDEARETPVPWADARLYETNIRRNIKLAEAPSYGQSIFDYAPDSNGARDYQTLAREIHTLGVSPVKKNQDPSRGTAPATSSPEPSPAVRNADPATSAPNSAAQIAGDSDMELAESDPLAEAVQRHQHADSGHQHADSGHQHADSPRTPESSAGPPLPPPQDRTASAAENRHEGESAA